LSSAYEPVDDQRVFLDTIAVPPATIVETFPNTTPRLAPSLTRIKIDFTNVDPGTFVLHCHMLTRTRA
jgi:FtsP/CotA-like multicopper oxidase with cupredoxin domain